MSVSAQTQRELIQARSVSKFVCLLVIKVGRYGLFILKLTLDV